MRAHRIAALAVLVFLSARCSLGALGVPAAGDPEVATAVVELQSKAAAYFASFDDRMAPATHPSFFDEVRRDLASLVVRTGDRRPGSPTRRALAALQDNFDRLEVLDQQGLSAAEAAVLHELFETQFQTLLRLEGSKGSTGKEN